MPDENLVEGILRRRGTLRNRRGLWANHWDDLARVMLPRRLGFVADVTEGDRRTEDIYDGTPMQAARGLANALGMFLRPIGEQWFFIRASAPGGQEWLEDVEKKMMDALDNPAARLRQATGEVDIDLVVFGTGVMFVGEGDDSLLFQSLHLKDALPIFSDEGRVEGMIRDHKLTVRQARDKFGSRLSEDTRDKIEREELDDKVDFVHAVVPRREGQAGAFLSVNFEWADLWIEREAKRIVKRGGFREFPFVVPRWDTSSGEEYGRSPGMIALPDSNSAQAVGETLLIAGQRAADPALAVPNDSAFDAPNTVPGGLAYYDVDTARALGGKSPFFEIGNGGNIPLTREMQEDIRNQIWNAFFRNVLRLPTDNPQMTATEINARKDEFIREIGPVFGRLESDYTAPIIERVFSIMLNAGAFLPIPEELEGASVTFEYQSPIKKARQQIKAAATSEWARGIVEISTVKPEILDKVNVDALANFTAEAANLPLSLINSDRIVARIRDERAQAEAAQAKMAEMQQLAETLKTGSEVIPGIKEALTPGEAA